MARLVDSRDIVELQLKQSDYELVIRKKEALQPPPATAMPQSAPPMYYPTLPSPPPPPSADAYAPTSSPPLKATPALPPPKNSASSHPPLKCPMAGTFYRCPGPGEPPFVQVCEHRHFESHTEQSILSFAKNTTTFVPKYEPLFKLLLVLLLFSKYTTY
jgi:acetyl-CoA carboxylase biotin carboxyl carrier protein